MREVYFYSRKTGTYYLSDAVNYALSGTRSDVVMGMLYNICTLSDFLLVAARVEAMLPLHDTGLPGTRIRVLHDFRPHTELEAVHVLDGGCGELVFCNRGD